MSNDLTIFSFEGNNVRVAQDERGELWFNANDVCLSLEMGNPSQAIKSHVDPEDLQKLETLTTGGIQRQNYINESGLYALILGSTKDAAKRFKRWVTHEVLPAIRKTGHYALTGKLALEEKLNEKRRQTKVVADYAKSVSALCLVLGIRGPQRMIAIENTLRREGVELGELVVFPGPAQTSNGRYAAVVEDRLITPSQIGVSLGGKSPRSVNILLEDLGLQERIPNAKGGFDWAPTSSGKPFSDWIETGKRHHTGAPVTALRWKETAILAEIRRHQTGTPATGDSLDNQLQFRLDS